MANCPLLGGSASDQLGDVRMSVMFVWQFLDFAGLGELAKELICCLPVDATRPVTLHSRCRQHEHVRESCGVIIILRAVRLQVLLLTRSPQRCQGRVSFLPGFRRPYMYSCQVCHPCSNDVWKGREGERERERQTNAMIERLGMSCIFLCELVV